MAMRIAWAGPLCRPPPSTGCRRSSISPCPVREHRGGPPPDCTAVTLGSGALRQNGWASQRSSTAYTPRGPCPPAQGAIGIGGISWRAEAVGQSPSPGSAVVRMAPASWSMTVSPSSVPHSGLSQLVHSPQPSVLQPLVQSDVQRRLAELERAMGELRGDVTGLTHTVRGLDTRVTDLHRAPGGDRGARAPSSADETPCGLPRSSGAAASGEEPVFARMPEPPACLAGLKAESESAAIADQRLRELVSVALGELERLARLACDNLEARAADGIHRLHSIVECRDASAMAPPSPATHPRCLGLIRSPLLGLRELHGDYTLGKVRGEEATPVFSADRLLVSPPLLTWGRGGDATVDDANIASAVEVEGTSQAFDGLLQPVPEPDLQVARSAGTSNSSTRAGSSQGLEADAEREHAAEELEPLSPTRAAAQWSRGERERANRAGAAPEASGKGPVACWDAVACSSS